jgi:hypothetical protein
MICSRSQYVLLVATVMACFNVNPATRASKPGHCGSLWGRRQPFDGAHVVRGEQTLADCAPNTLLDQRLRRVVQSNSPDPFIAQNL